MDPQIGLFSIFFLFFKLKVYSIASYDIPAGVYLPAIRKLHEVLL